MSSEHENRQQTEAGAPGIHSGGGPVLHVIDDDEPVRQALAMLLRSAGISVETYPSGLAFLDARAGFMR